MNDTQSKIYACFPSSPQNRENILNFKENLTQHPITQLLPLFQAKLGNHQGNPSLLCRILRRTYGNLGKKNPSFFLDKENSFSEEIWNDLEKAFQDKGIMDTFQKEEKETFLKDLQHLRRLNPAQYLLWCSVFKHAILLRNTPIKSSSLPKLFGVFIVGEGFFHLSKMKRVEYLVHELAHQELFLLNMIDKLSGEKTKDILQYSPFAKKFRPPIGRLHAYFALYRSIEFLIVNGQLSSIDEKYFFYLEETVSSFSGPELTPYAWSLLGSWEKNRTILQTFYYQEKEKKSWT